jgi:hypothetical protein
MKFITQTLLCTLLIGVFISCKDDDRVELLEPGILLSTDVTPSGWYGLRDFLKENHIRITFYVDGYDKIKDSKEMFEKEAEEK